MPTLSSIPLIRHSLRLHPPTLSPISRHIGSISAASDVVGRNPRSLPPSKNHLRARESVRSRELSSLSLTSLSSFERKILLPNQAIGLVAASQANFMRVIVETPGDPPPPNLNPSPFAPDPRVGTELLCVVRALLKKIKRRVLVGDRVLVGSVDWTSGRGMIEDAFERKTEICDPPVANVDHLLVLFAMDQPRPEPFMLTRFLVEAESMEIPFTLAMNKVELVSDENWGSKWLGEQPVDAVSKKSGLGKHTTRNISLLPLAAGGYLCDTPGFSQPSLLKVTKRSLANTFPEIRQRLRDIEPKKCAFNDCLHLGERGCVVNADWERYPYYFQLLDEIKIREEFQLRTLGTKREGDVRYKVGEMGVKQAEPRLELKKHRRVSRKQINQSILDDVDDDIEEAGY